jgi:drug/metabolite transporter (DMT)-like permease
MTNRRNAKIGLLCIVIFFGLFLVFRSLDSPKETPYWIGLGIGILAGIITSIYMMYTWKTDLDPNRFIENNRDRRLRWMTIVVILGLLGGQLAVRQLPMETEIAVTNCILMWLILTIVSLVLKS